MSTWTALTQTAGREAAEALTELAEDLTPEPVGTGIFEIEDGRGRWEVGLYFTERPDELALALMAAAWGADPFVLSELPEVDWVAMSGANSRRSRRGASSSTAAMTPTACPRAPRRC